MKYIALAVTLAACGSVDHRVSGEAKSSSEVHVTLDIDTSACDELYGEDKRQCIKDLVEVLKVAAALAEKAKEESE